MTIKVKLIDSGDDVFLIWNVDHDIPGCLGFAIERKRNGGAPEVLKNRVDFTAGNDGEGFSGPSTAAPFQRLSWTDHSANRGDTVSYRVTAMLGAPGEFTEGEKSAWTPAITVDHTHGSVSAFFNRGVVLSQFMSRMMAERKWKIADIKKHAKIVDDALRTFLSGDLRLAMLAVLDDALKNTKIKVYGALFELSDEELLGRLELLGPRLNLILANGAVKKKDEDENDDARTRLKAAGATVHDRMCAPRFLGHNKFLVLEKSGTPKRVWTGSTNWMPTGLCTQANNGLLIDDDAIAADYKAAWERIRDAGDDKTDDLRDGNSATPAVRTLADGSRASARFTSVKNDVDLDELKGLIAGARKSIFFAMFMPGADVFNPLIERKDEIFLRGVANTIPAASKDVIVDLVGGQDNVSNFKLTAVEPEGIEHPFASWAAEITKRQFSAIGHAIIHSKVLVIDCFTANPIVVTGSHNLSKTASEKNDENFVVIRGNKSLAEAYAVNCLALYDHYRWRQYVADCERQGKTPWSHLSTDADWLKKYRQSPSRKALAGVFGL